MEILRYYYNHADVNERDLKNFKFPVVFPMVFFSGKDKWTVPLSIRDMFENSDNFGNYILNFDYMLLDVKGYNYDDLKKFGSKLLGTILMLEKSKDNMEFYNNFRQSLDNIKSFDNEEMRLFNLCIKIMDTAYGYNKTDEIETMLNENKIREFDKMLCDIIENVKYEREQLITQGKLETAIEIAKNLLKNGVPVKVIFDSTGLDEEFIKRLEIDVDENAILS